MDVKFVSQVNTLMASIVGAVYVGKNTYEFKDLSLHTPINMGFDIDLNKLQEVVGIISKWPHMQHLWVDFRRDWLSLDYVEFGIPYRSTAVVSEVPSGGNRYPSYIEALYTLVGEFLIWRFEKSKSQEVKK